MAEPLDLEAIERRWHPDTMEGPDPDVFQLIDEVRWLREELTKAKEIISGKTFYDARRAALEECSRLCVEEAKQFVGAEEGSVGHGRYRAAVALDLRISRMAREGGEGE